jgi:POT family proton-dependent oligopeptide transporter
VNQQTDDAFYDNIEQAFGQPKALWFLFVTEMWERFSYYGMRALLIYYMTQNFLFGDEKSFGIYGAYTALVYLSPVFGGIIADRILGYRKGVTVGAIFMAIGHFVMAFQVESVFYLALALLIVGNGFFKPNMTTIIGRLYRPDDPRRDSGYTIFYMGVNTGAMIAGIVCPAVGARWGYHWGFTLAGFGMLFGLLVFLKTQHYVHGVADPPDPERLRRPLLGPLNRESLVWIGGCIAVAGVWALIQRPEYLGSALGLFVGGVLLWVFVISLRSEHVTRHRLWVVLTLLIFTVVFWAFFEQAGSSLSLFAQRNIDTSILGFDFHPGILQSVNPIFILIYGPVFVWLWIFLDRRGLNPSTPLKFALGIIQLGLGYVALYYGCFINQQSGVVPIAWILLGYMLHTTGELCLSPVGLSMVSKLAPVKMGAMMMGTWYLALALANYAAGEVAKLATITGVEGLDPVNTVMVYGNVFGKLALISIAVGAILALLSPLIRRGMHGVK